MTVDMSDAIKRAISDKDYKAKLTSDPAAALAEVNIELPLGMTVLVLEDTDQVCHLVLPNSSDTQGALSDQDLGMVAGGMEYMNS